MIAATPWRVGPINYADVYDAEGNVIALVPKGWEWTVDTVQLIVKAPELLEVLKDCVNGLGCQPGYVKGITLDRARHLIEQLESKI